MSYAVRRRSSARQWQRSGRRDVRWVPGGSVGGRRDTWQTWEPGGYARDRRLLFPEVAADFFVGDVAATGSAAGSAAGVVSIDVLQLLHDPRALVAEAARVLRPGGRFVATTWEGPAASRASVRPGGLIGCGARGVENDPVSERVGNGEVVTPRFAV